MVHGILLRQSEVQRSIPYLDEKHLRDHSDVQIKSIICDASIKVNKIVLASLSPLLRPILEEISALEIVDASIICDFSQEEIEYLENVLFGTSQNQKYLPQKEFLKPLSLFGIKLNQEISSTITPENYDEDTHFDSNLHEIEDYTKFPNNITLSTENTLKKKRVKLKEYHEKYKDFIRVGIIPQIDKDLLLKYELPAPIESYLKNYARNGSTEKIPKGSGQFQCHLCKYRSKKPDMTKHISKYHDMKLTCPHCNKTYLMKLRNEFIQHMFLHSNANELTMHECISCGYKSDVLSRIENHRQTSGIYHNNQCSQCECKFRSYNEYANHVATTHMNNWKFRCGICPKVFDTRKEVSRHISEIHRNKIRKSVICEKCGKTFQHEVSFNCYLGFCASQASVQFFHHFLGSSKVSFEKQEM